MSSTPRPVRTIIYKRGIVPLHVGERIEADIGDVADQIARRLGADKGQHQIGAFLGAPLAQGDAEIIGMTGNADLGRDVDQPGQTDRGIDHEAAECVAGLVAIALQHVVDQHDGGIEIVQRIVNAIARRFGHDALR